MQTGRIRHTVAFSLRHEPGSQAAEAFLAEGSRELAAIPSVRDFECLRQVSPKNGFQYGFSMEFDDEDGYAAYNEHPRHVAFVEQRWVPEVSDFLEADFVAHG